MGADTSLPEQFDQRMVDDNSRVVMCACFEHLAGSSAYGGPIVFLEGDSMAGSELGGIDSRDAAADPNIDRLLSGCESAGD